MKRFLGSLVLAGLVWAGDVNAEPGRQTIAYPGMCDASAAVAINDRLFVVANDEDNVLRLYRRGEPGQPQQVDLSGFLGAGGKHLEADIEGAARIGDTIYWIGSHGQNRDGKDRPNRHRFFATKVMVQGESVELKPEGQVYADLRADLIDAPEFRKYQLEEAANRAPEDLGGFNIEGLAATPDGAVLIGFRNPLFKGSSIVVPLLNPRQVIGGAKPEFGTPSELNLGERGIRSIEYSESRRLYLIVAGPTDDDGSFALFAWSGTGDQIERVPNVEFAGLKPEAMMAYPGEAAAVEFLSDDGGVDVNGVVCKKANPAARRFRAWSWSGDRALNPPQAGTGAN
jgi:hypothetical protein